MKNRVITNKQREYNGEPDIFRNYWLCGVSDGSNTFTTSDARMVIDNLKSISPEQIYKNIELIEDIDILEIFNSYLTIKENDYYFILESRIPISFDMVDLFCKQFTFKLKTRQELLKDKTGMVKGIIKPNYEQVITTYETVVVGKDKNGKDIIKDKLDSNGNKIVKNKITTSLPKNKFMIYVLSEDYINYEVYEKLDKII